jgi:polyisoprenoid-binding protein YceI
MKKTGALCCTVRRTALIIAPAKSAGQRVAARTQTFFIFAVNAESMNLFAVVAAAVLTMAASPDAQTIRSIDVEHSKMTVYVYKQGLFSFLADNHVIDAPIARGTYDSARRSVSILVDAASIRVVDPNLSADKRSKVQANMSGPQVLDAAKYPSIVFESTQITDAGKGRSTVSGNLELHGQTHPVTFDAQSDGAGHFTGTAMVRQSSFGITPIKIAGGAVSVKDDVRIDFSITLSGS